MPARIGASLAGIAIGQCSRLASRNFKRSHRQQGLRRHAMRCSSSPNRPSPDQAKYEKDFQQQAAKTIKDAGGRFIVRTTEVTSLTGEPPKRVVVLGFESIDEVKKWQGGEYAKLIPIRDQIGKWRSFAVPTCENPQGAKPG